MMENPPQNDVSVRAAAAIPVESAQPDAAPSIDDKASSHSHAPGITHASLAHDELAPAPEHQPATVNEPSAVLQPAVATEAAHPPTTESNNPPTDHPEAPATNEPEVTSAIPPEEPLVHQQTGQQHPDQQHLDQQLGQHLDQHLAQQPEQLPQQQLEQHPHEQSQQTQQYHTSILDTYTAEAKPPARSEAAQATPFQQITLPPISEMLAMPASSAEAVTGSFDLETHPSAVEKGQSDASNPTEENKPELEEFGRRPESLLLSPLTHPNGMSMFPTLSTSEQEDLAREALSQAEASIIAESFESPHHADDATDGGYESDSFSSASTSAESSVRDYMYENGRRYHRFREGTYNFPNDDVEQEREDMKHAMVKLLCSQKLHFAPIGNNPQEILDIGTGTGIWTIESKLSDMS